MKHKRILHWIFILLFFVVVIGLSIEESRIAILAFLLRVFLFVKHHIVALVATFFLVNGKFILTLFLKKVALLSVTGLGKRYMIEKVIMENLKIHLFDHIKEDIAKLLAHAKKNFKRFTIVKKMITLFIFLGSLSFVGKFMGSMLAIKVFVAKVWSFLLALFLKISAAIVYFFTDYLWNSWLAPIIELVLFSWLFSLMEKVPFLAKGFKVIYTFFREMFAWVEEIMDRLFYRHLRLFLRWLVRYIQRYIYLFIGYKRVSAYKAFKEKRKGFPSRYKALKIARQERREILPKNSIREVWLEKRKGRKRVKRGN